MLIDSHHSMTLLSSSLYSAVDDGPCLTGIYCPLEKVAAAGADCFDYPSLVALMSWPVVVVAQGFPEVAAVLTNLALVPVCSHKMRLFDCGIGTRCD